MNHEMFVGLGAAAERAAADSDVFAVLLSAQGPTFCAGIDLTELAGLARVQGAEFRAFVRMAQRPLRALATMDGPVVAAVQGHAVGAGFQLALAADLRVAAQDVRFGMLEARYGLIPDLGGAYRLVRLVGPSRAKELIWTTRLVECDEAERIGLVDRVVDGEPGDAAAALVAEILAVSPIPVALSKALIDRAHDTPFETELEREQHAQSVCVASDDHREAMAAFMEKRPARYTGR
jgi:enoyl-CoA hydratase/carnithine racemase